MKITKLDFNIYNTLSDKNISKYIYLNLEFTCLPQEDYYTSFVNLTEEYSHIYSVDSKNNFCLSISNKFEYSHTVLGIILDLQELKIESSESKEAKLCNLLKALALFVCYPDLDIY